MSADHVHVPGSGHETRDASVPGLLKFGGGLVVALIVVMLLMRGFYSRFESRRPEEPKVEEQTNIYQQLRDLHTTEDRALSHYDWVDRQAGIVRIPISRAIELVAEKGDRFGKGPKTALEMNSHAGAPVAAPSPSELPDIKTPPSDTGPKP